MISSTFAISAENIHKSFNKVPALLGVRITVPEGTVFGLLGPNGAGKTTLVRILTTLLKPEEGVATVGGFDVVKNAKDVRYMIGLAGQYAAVDETLTGRENLYMFGKLYHLGDKESLRRADELLQQFSLTDAAHKVLKTYSGGMRRRLDLAASLVNKPKILFLDEPTTGLDPQSRLALWDIIKQLVKDGTTVLLTTQYLEEADRLADKIAVIDHGKVIAEGTPTELKAQIGGEVIELHLPTNERLDEAALALTSLGTGSPSKDPTINQIILPIKNGTKVLMSVMRTLDDLKIDIEDVVVRKPTLDEVFLKLTGHSM